MNCPICNMQLNIAERTGIEVDYCPQCHGVWLDRGELDKIIERSTNQSHFGEYNDHQHHEGLRNHGYYEEREHISHKEHSDYGLNNKHRKKSFLEDFFDFG